MYTFVGGVCFYNSNKQFLDSQFGLESGGADYTNELVTIPPGAVYLNASTQNATIKDVSLITEYYTGQNVRQLAENNDQRLDAVEPDISELKREVYGTDKSIDATGITTPGTCYNNMTGAPSTSHPNANATKQHIEIEADATYYCTGRVYSTVGGVCFYNANKEYLSSQFGLENSGENYTHERIIIPTNAVYLNASTQNNNIVAVSLEKVAKQPTLREEATAHANAIRVLKDGTACINHVYVATTGNDTTGDGTFSKPYASIYKANESIQDNTENNQYIIHVADGTYTDLQTRYAGSAPVNYEGIVCKNYVYYEGNIQNPNACVLEWDGANGYDTLNYSNTAIYKCLFHLVGEMVTAIRGFKLKSTNTRYCLHIEMSGLGRGSKWEVSDCIFEWYGTPDCTDRSYSPPCIGTGSGIFEKGYLVHCKIDNRSDSGIGWMNHDSPNYYSNVAMVEGPEIIIEACDFDGMDICWRNIYGDDIVNGFDRFSVIDCININKLYYTVATPSTVCKWRGLIKCSQIIDNVFAAENLLQ